MERAAAIIVSSVASITDIDRNAFKDARPTLFIRGILPPHRAAEITNSIRRCWQGAKIIVLFEEASPADLQKLLASGFDACVPVLASSQTVIDAVELMVLEGLRVLVMGDPTTSHRIVNLDKEEDEEATADGDSLVTSLASSLHVAAPAMPDAGALLAEEAGDSAALASYCHVLSEREARILQMLVRGYSNKMIARIFRLSEATVKAHMRSILLKIRVANRTQAAIWALKNTR